MYNIIYTMKVLVLFSGTGSIGDVCKRRGFEVVSLDRDMPADSKTGIMDWDYKTSQPKDFDFKWASPPCTEYSIAKTVAHCPIV
jgi:site-specific DNA-cytosine methylase